MSKNTKMILVVVAVAVAGYFAIRWYENRKASQNGNTQGGAGDGSNLNSVAPELVGGSTGPSIGPALSTPITINVTTPPSMANPVGALDPNISSGPVSANDLTGVTGNTSVTSSLLAAANPDNAATGAQSRTPQSGDASGGGIASAATGPTYSTPMSANSSQPNATTRNGQKPPVNVPVSAKPVPVAKPITRPGTPKKRKEPAK